MTTTLLLAFGLMISLVLARHLGRAHPCTWFSFAWTALIAMHLAIPLGLYPINLFAAVIIVTGLLSFGIGALFIRRNVSRRRLQEPISSTLLITWAIVITVMLVYGVYSFQHEVAASVGVQDFGSIDPTEIRFATTLGGARGGGIGDLMFALSPLVGCLGLLAGLRIHRLWLLLLPVAFWASTQSPGRTFTLGLMAAMLPFYFYVRKASRPRHMSRVKTVSIASGTLVAAVVYFNAIGQILGKTEVFSQYFNHTWVPDSLLSPLVYQIGGMSALSAALDENHDPVAGEFGRSIFAVMRIGSSLGLPIESPNTIPDSVLIPIPFNVYTGFGDVWFDFGLTGVCVMFLALGALAAYAHGRALAGGLRWAWTSSMLLSVLASTPLSLRVFYLDVVTQMGFGLVVFTSLTWRRKLDVNEQVSSENLDAREPQGQNLANTASHPTLTSGVAARSAAAVHRR